jgi:asparagine synthase (glutamine-hydrolysing)
VSSDAVLAAARRLVHRGPDAQTVWTASHGHVGLGHARLSIIDLATGHQPIANEDESLHIVVNGEFYDFEAIRRRLQESGHVFRTGSDSEIALHLYEDLGARALHHLRGEFAFALWDERDGVLFAARDRFGIKPLYYAFVDGTCHVASEVKALQALGVPLRWDRESLFDSHYGLLHAPSRSTFAGVFQVPPGCYLLTDGVHAHVHSYWDFNYPLAEVTQAPCDPHEAIERLRAALYEAVRLRLRADVPVACYLSGGLDSCSVLGIASDIAAQPLRAYTLSFDMADYDERALAEAQAAQSGAEFHPIPIHADQLAHNLADALYYAERPFVNAHAVAKYLLSRAVRDSGLRVVMTGEGADEVFAGYPFFRRDLVLYNIEGQDPADAKRLLDALTAANPVSAGLLLPTGETGDCESVRRVLGFVPTILATWRQQGTHMRDLLHPEFSAPFADRDSYRALLNHLDVEHQLSGREPVNQSLYLWGKTMLPNYILSNLGDRMEMAHSVEGRLPFLDHKVVEEVVKLPVAMKIQGMTEKHALREAARPVITDDIYRRQKHPFLAPPATLQTEGALWELIQDTLRGDTLKRAGLYDSKKVVDILDRVPAMSTTERTSVDVPLTWMTSLCLLQERLAMTE